MSSSQVCLEDAYDFEIETKVVAWSRDRVPQRCPYALRQCSNACPAMSIKKYNDFLSILLSCSCFAGITGNPVEFPVTKDNRKKEVPSV